MPFVLEAPEDQSQVLKDTSLDIWYPLNYPVQYVKDLKMIGKGLYFFKINSSPSAFYIIKPTCIS